jgi:hypothetical protein
VADGEPDDNPGTAPFVPDFDDDSGPLPVPRDKPEEQTAEPEEQPKQPEPSTSGVAAKEDSTSEPPVVPVTVPGRYQYLKWWKLVAVILGVWCAAAVLGLGLFYWWFHTVDKTWPVFAVLVYVVACSVAGVLLAMAEGRPLISALSLAVMSGPFASIAAAAPLYGYYYCERTGHCLLSVIPY